MGDLKNSRIVPEVTESKVEPPAVQVDPSVADLINDPAVAPEPEQVKPEEVIFVAQEDFEGRINQQEYAFVKGVPVRMDKEQANTWVEAKKGYIK